MRNLLIATVFVTTAAVAYAACDSRSDSKDSSESVTELTEPRNALTEELMVALAQAKNFHHKADVHLKDAQLDLAIDSVRQVLTIPFPESAPEAKDVLLDARARLAKLLVTKGELDEAMKVANEGLAADERESFFLANLFTVRGHVWEARAIRADEQEDKAAGVAARRKALEDFDRSITINKAVLKRIAGQQAK